MLFRSAKNKFETVDVVRRIKRLAEGTISSYRRLFLLLLCVCIVFYMLPPIFRYLFLSQQEQKGKCITYAHFEWVWFVFCIIN